jgi:hypothetical protein
VWARNRESIILTCIKRRAFTAEYKQRILRDVDAALASNSGRRPRLSLDAATARLSLGPRDCDRASRPARAPLDHAKEDSSGCMRSAATFAVEGPTPPGSRRCTTVRSVHRAHLALRAALQIAKSTPFR